MKTTLLSLLALLALAPAGMAQTTSADISKELMRKNAERLTSQSNLKQLALGIIMYTQDHDEYLPDAGRWVDEIMPYVKNQALFHDPSAPASQKWCYAYNRTLSHASLAQIESPATTVMLFESLNGVKNASDAGQSVPRPGRHSGGTDYAFTDGHVKYYLGGSAKAPYVTYALSAVTRSEIPINGHVYDILTHKSLRGTFVIFSQSPKTVTSGSVWPSSFTNKTGHFQSMIYPGRNYLMVLVNGRFKLFGRMLKYRANGNVGTVTALKTQILSVGAASSDYIIRLSLPSKYTLQASSSLDKVTGLTIMAFVPVIRALPKPGFSTPTLLNKQFAR